MSQEKKPTPRKRPSVRTQQKRPNVNKVKVPRTTVTQDTVKPEHFDSTERLAHMRIADSVWSEQEHSVASKTAQSARNMVHPRRGRTNIPSSMGVVGGGRSLYSGSPNDARRERVSSGASRMRRASAAGRTRNKVIVAILVVCALALGVDYGLTNDRIYGNIRIGDLDVGGKTTAEAAEMISDEYSMRLPLNTAVFYSSQEALDNPDKATEVSFNSNDELTEEEGEQFMWKVPATKVSATLDAEALAQQAYDVGRSDGLVFGRIDALLNGRTIELECTFEDADIDDIRMALSARVGQVRQNFDVKIEEGKAEVVEGHDGHEVTSEWVRSRLNEAFLSPQIVSSYVVELIDMPLQIQQEEAQRVADVVNNSIQTGAQFTYEDDTWEISAKDMAKLVTTRVDEAGENYVLTPCFSMNALKKQLLEHLREEVSTFSTQVNFEKRGHEIWVVSDATGTVPDVKDAAEKLERDYFTDRERSEAVPITLQSTELSNELVLDDALDYGVVDEIDSYTTKYASSATARVNNIHVAADLLDNSIVGANGGEWNWQEVVGEANEANGFKSAGVISGGEHADAIGGGVCQVATTVFNAVYEAGLPVVERHNHTLYVATYPEGRDAAIAFPTLNLIWTNSTNSDILVQSSYTDSSVTVYLYGKDPKYEVKTKTGQRYKGQAFQTRYRYDSTVKSGTEFVEQNGLDGSSISVTRTVSDSSGNVVRTDVFDSYYTAQDKIIVKGTG